MKGQTQCETWELDGFFQQQYFFMDHISLVREAFWHEQSAEKAADVLKWLMYNDRGVHVAIHIRLGDYKYTNRNMPMQYYEDALLEVSTKNGGQNLTCVIFSDDIKEAMTKSEGLSFCSKKVPVPPELGEVHSFYMMALFPNIVIADSSFSFWAARLSPTAPFVVAPAVFKDTPQAQSAYEYLMQTPGWKLVNTTTDLVDKVAEGNTLQLIQTGGETFRESEGYYSQFESEWAY